KKALVIPASHTNILARHQIQYYAYYRIRPQCSSTYNTRAISHHREINPNTALEKIKKKRREKESKRHQAQEWLYRDSPCEQG
ncbi:hypothetical protein COCHEDRAFT_1018383, partial [Bipolaris maydis C5]